MLKTAFGDECFSLACTLEWFQLFKDGGTSVTDDSQSRQPSTSRNYDSVTHVRVLLHANKRLKST